MSEIPIIRNGWATTIDIDRLTKTNTSLSTPCIRVKTPFSLIQGKFDRIYDHSHSQTAFPTNLAFYIEQTYPEAEDSISVTIDGTTYPVSDHVVISVRGRLERGVVDSLLRATVEAINTVDSERGK
jgi:hypothetical protein